MYAVAATRGALGLNVACFKVASYLTSPATRFFSSLVASVKLLVVRVAGFISLEKVAATWVLGGTCEVPAGGLTTVTVGWVAVGAMALVAKVVALDAASLPALTPK